MCHHRGYPLREVDWDQKAEELRAEDPEAAAPDPEPEPEDREEPDLLDEAPADD